MRNKNENLLQIAKDFIRESNMDVIYAFVGGSVGRGEADKYSDVDLTIYTNTNLSSNKSDVIYNGEIIQLETLHIDELPNQHMIEESPWDYRFLNEITIVKDEADKFSKIKQWATTYFGSENAKKKMVKQVSEMVKERTMYAFDYLKQHKVYSATHASMGAWAEAGFLYLFLNHNSLSTGLLIPRIQNLKVHFEEFKRVSPFSIIDDLSEVPVILSRFRKYLRKQGHSYIGLCDIHDTLCERKVQRLLNNNEDFNLLWQMYGEALWIYFETSNGLSFEQYFDNLPNELQKDLSKIGFIPLEEKKVRELCRLSDELLTLSC
ncbi:nucleotidyltransferase domain-containing protein [Aneurinibacillus aneurinilyticus]|uniref:nucleotidyltransferase domain-containing protein n=1 Tax=Aneurinibacillus aneurinilyticus TaxID=1391 RepID=UPI0035233270